MLMHAIQQLVLRFRIPVRRLGWPLTSMEKSSQARSRTVMSARSRSSRTTVVMPAEGSGVKAGNAFIIWIIAWLRRNHCA